MSGAEVLAVIGIVSNILQLADFCTRVTDRAVEFAGRTAELPGSFSDLRVVLAVVRLNLKRLSRRVTDSEPDDETARTLNDLVTIIQREMRYVQERLARLPEPGSSSWAKVTLRAVTSVFNDSKIKRSTDSILQNVELLSQTVTASLPTADEIANAVNEKSTTVGIDRKLSMILDKMKSHAITRANTNATAFTNRSRENRVSTSHGIKVKGHTQINNTYITLQIPYEELGAQLDKNGGRLMVPGTAGSGGSNDGAPFTPLKQAISNPNLYQTAHGRRNTEPQAIIAAPAFDMGPGNHNAALDIQKLLASSSLSPGHEKLKPYPPAIDTGADSRPKTSRSQTEKMYSVPDTRVEEIDDDGDSFAGMDGDTVIGSVVTSHNGTSLDAVGDNSSNGGGKSHVLAPPQSPRHFRSPSAPTPSTPTIATVSSPEQLHSSYCELEGDTMPALKHVASPPSMSDSLSEVRTASDIWSETAIEPHNRGVMHASGGRGGGGDETASTAYSGSTVVSEDEGTMNTVNAYIHRGAAAVTQNPSEAKRAYMSALNTCKTLVTYSPAFSVRKYRALTMASVGLSLCTMERDRYLHKARDYNAQAHSAAAASGDRSAQLRVALDEADLHLKEARLLAKTGQDPTMKHFTAFGAYQNISSRLTAAATEAARQFSSHSQTYPSANTNGRHYNGHGATAGRGSGSGTPSTTLLGSLNVGDCNTHAQALVGCAKAAALLESGGGVNGGGGGGGGGNGTTGQHQQQQQQQQPRTFHTANGPILSPRAYYEQALAACRAGVEAGVSRAAAAQARGEHDWASQSAEDLALIKDTEAMVLRSMGSSASSSSLSSARGRSGTAPVRGR